MKTHWWKPAALPGTYRTRQRYMSVVSETRSLSDFCRAVKLQGEPYEYVWESIKTKQNEGTGAVRNLILLPQDSPQWGTVHILLRIGVQLLTQDQWPLKASDATRSRRGFSLYPSLLPLLPFGPHHLLSTADTLGNCSRRLTSPQNLSTMTTKILLIKALHSIWWQPGHLQWITFVTLDQWF